MSKAVDPAKLVVNVAQDNPTVAALQFIRDDSDGVEYELLEGGFVNYVYKVTSRDKKSSVIIKYGETRMKLMPDEEISMKRQLLEYNCLKILDSIHPGGVPTPFCLDTMHNVIVMQDLSGWEHLWDQLNRQHVDQAVAINLGHILGKVHSQTSWHTVTEDQWQDLLSKFRQTELKAYDCSLLFERPFHESDPMTKIPDDMLEEYRAFVKEVQELGLDVKLQTLFDVETCLVHGDCHHRAVFVKDGRAVQFDFELAFIGHPALHVGFLLVGYMVEAVLSKIITPTITADNTSCNHHQFNVDVIQAISNFIDAYVETSHKNLTSEAFFSELTLFVGGILFMISGFSGLEDMRQVLPGDRTLLLDKAHTFMTRHHTIFTPQDFMALCDTAML